MEIPEPEIPMAVHNLEARWGFSLGWKAAWEQAYEEGRQDANDEAEFWAEYRDIGGY
jgi:hypothetical protein